jgi:hypothetical protein
MSVRSELNRDLARDFCAEPFQYPFRTEPQSLTPPAVGQPVGGTGSPGNSCLNFFTY